MADRGRPYFPDANVLHAVVVSVHDVIHVVDDVAGSSVFAEVISVRSQRIADPKRVPILIIMEFEFNVVSFVQLFDAEHVLNAMHKIGHVWRSAPHVPHRSIFMIATNLVPRCAAREKSGPLYHLRLVHLDVVARSIFAWFFYVTTELWPVDKITKLNYPAVWAKEFQNPRHTIDIKRVVPWKVKVRY